MNDLEALPPEPLNPPNAPPEPSARSPRRAKLLAGAAVLAAATLGGVGIGFAARGTSHGVLLAATTGPASSAACAPKGRAAYGTVSSVNGPASTFTIAAPKGGVTVTVASSTHYEVVALGTANDLTHGAAAIVRSKRPASAGGVPDAGQIVVLPPTSPAPSTVASTSLAGGTGTVTLTTPRGSKTFNVTAATKVIKVSEGGSLAAVTTGESVAVIGTSPAASVIVNKTGLKPPFGPLAVVLPSVCAPRLQGPGLKGRGAAGTVSNLNGVNFSVAGLKGTVNVTTSPSTVFTKQVSESVSQLAPGTFVTVRGAPSADGSSIAANAVTVAPNVPKASAPAQKVAGRARGVAAGTVVSNDASTGTLTITQPAGGTLKITTTPQVTVTAVVPATIADLHDGMVAVVSGPANTTGTIAAGRVLILPAGTPAGRTLGPWFGFAPGFGRVRPPGVGRPAGP